MYIKRELPRSFRIVRSEYTEHKRLLVAEVDHSDESCNIANALVVAGLLVDAADIFLQDAAELNLPKLYPNHRLFQMPATLG